jgi:hypothetical protein
VNVKQLGYNTYKADKKKGKDLQDKLARKASVAIAFYKSPLTP